MTLSAFLRALFSAETDTGMPAWKSLRTGHVASRTIAQLPTQFRASVMLAPPDACLVARITRVAAFLFALAVLAVVATVFLARRAVLGARFSAVVATEQCAVTLGPAWHMDSTTQTETAVT